MSLNIHHGDALAVLRTLPDASVNCCVTSPPYYGLRDYGVDGQIGLEKTPAEYIARLVDVFREVRRVLADDGTLFVNVGDSYASSNAAQVQDRKAAGGAFANRPPLTAGLKPKDLMGIPWSLATALRDQYYTGRIKRVEDRVWLAAMIDAEGCMFIHKRKAGQNNGQGYQRQNDNFGPGLEVANTSLAVVERCLAITGMGSICSQSPTQNNRRKQTIYRWNLRTTECRDVVREVYPYLVAKQQQARILCGYPSSGTQAEAAHAALIGLHNGIESSVDFPEPTSMYEPGFYLRQDVIWAKLNPMPESVKDRCTKAHEYIFMLSKSARYWWDAGAIAEAAKFPGDQGFLRGPVDGCDSGTISWRAKSQQQRKIAGVDSKTAGGDTRNRRSVWTLATLPTPEAHFATFPIELPELCIRAGCPEGGVVLDPFTGAGTTALACLKNGRGFVGIELSAEYIEIAQSRARKYYPLLCEATA